MVGGVLAPSARPGFVTCCRTSAKDDRRSIVLGEERFGHERDGKPGTQALQIGLGEPRDDLEIDPVHLDHAEPIRNRTAIARCPAATTMKSRSRPAGPTKVAVAPATPRCGQVVDAGKCILPHAGERAPGRCGPSGAVSNRP